MKLREAPEPEGTSTTCKDNTDEISTSETPPADPTTTYAIYTPGSGDPPPSRRRSGRRRSRNRTDPRRRGGSRRGAQKIASSVRDRGDRSKANPRDARQTDLYTILNKQNSRGQSGGGIADGKCQGSPTKGRVAYKDGKQFYPNESTESPYFGSSVHYGGRDFYDSSTHKQANGPSRNYKEDNSDGSLATRGDWWQGSLYY